MDLPTEVLPPERFGHPGDTWALEAMKLVLHLGAWNKWS